jgi:ubiquinone/menaquinone biosynthesis C-methylase UbiE
MLKKEQEYVKSTFNEVANKYDEIPFFKISARYVVELIQKNKKKENLQILDVACGTGNVVLESASCLPKARFDAVDISEGMLAKAEANAKERGLKNINFKLQDVTKLNLEKKYDVITCSYALFFLPEAQNVLKILLSLLKKDGIVIFTSFTKEAFNPSSDILLRLLRNYGSNSAKEYDGAKWENLKQIEDIERLCSMAGIESIAIESKEIRYGMNIDEWWELFNNTGYKGMLMELSLEDYEKVKEEFYEVMTKELDGNGEVELVADSYFVLFHNS